MAFYLKVILFILESFKYGLSYDFGPVYDELRESYVNADSQRLPGSRKLDDEDKSDGHLALRINL